MADAFTTFLNLRNPEVGASADSWGTKENTDRTTVDAMLSTMITGLTLSTAGSSATFGIAIGAASGMVLSSAYTKTTSAWALGTGNGALDTGAIANNTWYHVWEIQRSDTGVVDILISTSVSSPTMPTNYDRKRRIGSMKTDGSAHWIRFTQTGDKFIWYTTVNDYNSIVTALPISIALTVPPGLTVEALVRGYFGDSASVNTLGLISSLLDDITMAANSPAGNAQAVTQVVNQAAPFGQIGVLTDTSRQIRAVGSSGTMTVVVATAGWIDLRGKA